MEPLHIYILVFASLFGAVSLWRVSCLLSFYAKTSLLIRLRKLMFYTLIARRQQASSDVTVLSTVYITLYAAANVVVAAFKVSDRPQLARRCASLFAVNVTPLFLGGRTNLIMDKVLKITLNDYSLLHRWIGRVSLLLGLIHSVLNLTILARMPTMMEYTLFALTLCIGLTSFLWLRRRYYEAFLKSHLALSLGLLACLWIHTGPRNRLAVICLAIATSLWLLQHLLWGATVLYKNTGNRPEGGRLSSKSFDQTESAVTKLTIVPKRPLKVSAGQYVYITMPGLSLHDGIFLQSHPYAIAWTRGDTKRVDDIEEASDTEEFTVGKSVDELVLLIKKQRGFSNEIRLLEGSPRVVLDGPYGGNEDLSDFDTVFLMANGIGVASHFLTIKHLLQGHNKRTARVRRITLLWHLDSSDQERWGAEFLTELFLMDKRRIFTMLLYTPIVAKGWAEKYPVKAQPRIRSVSIDLNILKILNVESKAEAGNMVISICGTPLFEESVREAVRNTKRDIELVTADFQPEETEATRLAAVRYQSHGRAGNK